MCVLLRCARAASVRCRSDGEPGLGRTSYSNWLHLASTARYHLRDYVPRILDLVVEYWAQHLEQVVPLLEQVASDAQSPCGPSLPRALPLLLASWRRLPRTCRRMRSRPLLAMKLG